MAAVVIYVRVASSPRPAVVCSIANETICRDTADTVWRYPEMALSPEAATRVRAIHVRSGDSYAWTTRFELESGPPLIGRCIYVSEDLVDCEVRQET